MDKKDENIMNYNIDDVSLYSIDNGDSDSDVDNDEPTNNTDTGNNTNNTGNNTNNNTTGNNNNNNSNIIDNGDSDSDVDNDEPTNNTDIGNNTNIRENPLSWEIIDKNDKIEDLINKINYNFHQFAIRNGGAVGAPGQKGNDGFITMSRCGIHAIPKDNKDDIIIYHDEDNKSYKIQFKLDYDIRKGDIVIYDNRIFVCNDFNKDNNNTGTFKLVSEIIGKPGPKGDSFNTGSNFILSKDVNGLADIPYLFLKENNAQGIILYSNKDKLFDVSEKEDIMSSSLILTNNSDGITFTKINEKDKFIPVTVLRSKVDEFMVSDMSENGSTYSAKNTLSLYSNGDTISKSSNNIILGYEKDKPSISLFSKNNIYLKSNISNIESTDSIKLNSKLTNINGDILKIDVDKININNKILLDNTNGNISIPYNLNLSVIDSFTLSSNNKKRIEIKNDDQINIYSKEILWSYDSLKMSKILLDYDTSINRFNTTFSNSNITINGNIDCINLTCKKNDRGTGGIAEIDSLNINDDLKITIDADKEEESLKQIIKDLRNNIATLQQQVVNANESGNLPLGTIISTFNKNLTLFTNIGYHPCDGCPYSTVFKNDKDSAISFHKELTGVQLDSSVDLSKYYLPDMRDKVPITAGNKYSPLKYYGNETITINMYNIPAHVHQYCGDGDWGDHNGKNFIYWGNTSSEKRGGADNGKGRWYNTTASGSANPSPINITPKSIGINYLIKIKQIENSLK